MQHENKSAEPSVVTVNILSYQEKATRDQILKAYAVLTVCFAVTVMVFAIPAALKPVL